ncbi:cytochrome b5-like heme/steroid binding domain-containing protein [Amanita rubescens]|nr:cytochrome b5-like heme/steroid binding domain-containing protein [Amanita rubescens]
MSKIISVDELRANNTRDKLYVVIHGKVYNVTKFLDEHPGGDEVILAEAGRDATEAFEDVGHSDEARALLPNMYVGDIDPKSGSIKSTSSSSYDKSKVSNAVEQGSNMMYFVPLGLLGAYFGWRYYTGSCIDLLFPLNLIVYPHISLALFSLEYANLRVRWTIIRIPRRQTMHTNGVT